MGKRHTRRHGTPQQRMDKRKLALLRGVTTRVNNPFTITGSRRKHGIMPAPITLAGPKREGV